jgi:hypothetical protein
MRSLQGADLKDREAIEPAVFAEGLRRAGKGLTRESLVTALESMRDYNMGGFTVNYSPQSHEGSRFTDLTIIGRGGKFMR